MQSRFVKRNFQTKLLMSFMAEQYDKNKSMVIWIGYIDVFITPLELLAKSACVLVALLLRYM